MNDQSSHHQSSPDTTRLPSKLFKVLAVMAIVFAMIYFVVRSGAMRSYEQPLQDTQQGDHQGANVAQ